MNTKDFIRIGVPLGEATRRATDFVSKSLVHLTPLRSTGS